jgi:plastocyanin
MRERRVLATALTACLAALLALVLSACGSSGGYGTAPGAPSGGGAAVTTPTNSGGAGGYGYGSGTPSGGGSSAPVTTNTITMSNYQLSATNVAVKVGDKVTFKNQDSVAHHIVVGTTDLGVQAPGANVVWTAAKAGTVPFKCLIHSSMTGQFIVK